jgi:hypothetical protein
MKPQPGNDWFFIGKSFRKYYQNPSLMIADDDIGAFSDALEEIIPVKLKEILDAQDELIKNREEALGQLVNLKDLLDDELDIRASLIEYKFSEYDVLQKWLKYWLRLAQKSGHGDSWTSETAKGDFTSEQIGQAKNVPIQDIYEGKLRQMGSRYVGICPFHEEKTGSFTIFEETNSFYCFGCSRAGDVLDLYMKLNKCAFPQAVGGLLKHG